MKLFMTTALFSKYSYTLDPIIIKFTVREPISRISARMLMYHHRSKPRCLCFFLLAIILLVPTYSYTQQEMDSVTTVLTGTLSLNSTPAGIRVNLDGKNVGKTPLIISTISAGPHRVILFDPLYENMTMDLEIKPDDTVSVNVPMQTRHGMISLTPTVTEQQYRYVLNGRTIPSDSLSDMNLPVGAHSLKVFDSSNELILSEDLHSIAAQHSEYAIQFNKVNTIPMIMSAALPGLGQVHTGEYWKGTAILAAALTTGFFIVDANRSYSITLSEYNTAKNQYDRGIGAPASLAMVQALRNNVTKTYDAMSAQYRTRASYYYLYIGIVLLSELDIVLTHPTINTITFEVKPPMELKYPGKQEAFLPQLGITIKI